MGHKAITDKQVQAFGPGLHSVGQGATQGLMLQVKSKPNGDLWRSWIFRYRWTDPLTGKRSRPQLGLGGYPAVSLRRAREKASEARAYLTGRPKLNPRDVWDAEEKSVASIPTFGKAAEDYMASILGEFRNEKHKLQWRNTLTTYCEPIWKRPVNTIDNRAVLSVLTPIWNNKRETAKRVRGRMERVLDAARVKGWREGDNPARWKGNLSTILPDNKKERNHFAAMPVDDLPAFMQQLKAYDSMSSKALQFLILTISRNGEARGARWSEFDLPNRLWTLPPERMKRSRVHFVPLSEPTMAILEEMQVVRRGDFVFSQNGRQGVSETSLRKLMRQRLGVQQATVHGFRSTFRDWAGDRTSFPRETAELCLAHAFGDATERSYRRSEDLQRRRELLNAWARFCLDEHSKVVKIHGR